MDDSTPIIINPKILRDKKYYIQMDACQTKSNQNLQNQSRPTFLQMGKWMWEHKFEPTPIIINPKIL